MGSKKCFKCNIEKPLSEYYKHKQMGDGHLNKCKQCTKTDVLKHRAENLHAVRAYDRERANLPHRVQKRKEVAERWKADPELRKRTYELKKSWQEKNLIKRAAHVLTGNAIRDGRLIKKPCEVCGDFNAEAHHDDYTKPLDVRWLCRTHHAEYHKKEREALRLEKKASKDII